LQKKGAKDTEDAADEDEKETQGGSQLSFEQPLGIDQAIVQSIDSCSE